MSFPTPQQFAEILHKSLLSPEAKAIVLEKLPSLSETQILQIYEKLVEEQEKIKKTKSELESKLKFAELKFDQELTELKKTAE